MSELRQLPSKVDGWWITGLVDGEGCFYAGLNFDTKRSSSGRSVSCVELQAELTVGLRADDREPLLRMQEYFGCGKIHNRVSSKNAPSVIKQGLKDPKPSRRFIIRPRELLVSVVIPHFEKYPLQTKKARDFQIWKEIVLFAESELSARKGWLRRFPSKVDHLGLLCDQLKSGRLYVPQTDFVGGN